MRLSSEEESEACVGALGHDISGRASTFESSLRHRTRSWIRCLMRACSWLVAELTELDVGVVVVELSSG